MPWCEDCAKYWTPSAMNDDGSCPKCGNQPAAQQSRTGRPITARNINLHQLAAGDGNEADMKAPWHFRLLMVMLALYLGYRVVYLFL
ncbi:MAG: hypothetical protein HY826_13005 [Actinobacteria bacterium]|nr:hypothetical protein [Actinomycetota bacterium]